ncbi:broad substrate specificity ATP-binding cassette transporter ABCG2-like [Anneissia japonica]|uniref:broad substrate specificity ATP-binding cassette transporter ABCG2-like n=1 Tax=Anneissia japonica TaxID=1529436 RepID=UPI00142595C9|nr:broad substrate specificity ATP-binding cassette transporter ABCG2-like [Anneissia japonica]
MTETTRLLNGNEVNAGSYGGQSNSSQALEDQGELEKSLTSTHSVVSFHDITYNVPDKVAGKNASKTILKNISGIFTPGMNAIMGPTGGGKTSLLDVLAARKHPKGLSGVVLIDGLPQPAEFRLIAGYVVQDDVVMGTMSVRENLMFSASLRLGKEVSTQEKRQRVNNIIKELGLSKCADSKVGTAFIRGISGGERKRTNVGMELVTKPGILFLDEPTTGLDASTAKSVMSTLSDFTGFQCEAFNNPADFFLDIIIDHETESLKNRNSSENGTTKEHMSLVDNFKKSTHYTSLQDEATKLLSNYKQTQNVVVHKIDYPTSFLKQFAVLARRAFTNLIRNPQTSTLQILILVVLGLVVGGLFWQLDTSLSSGIQNRIGVFFFMIMNITFGNISALEVFIYERVIFMHESAGGFYRTSAYFFAKVLCDLVPMRMFPTSVYCCITYWMIGKMQLMA